MARPRKQAQDRRTKNIHIRLSEAEEAAMRALVAPGKSLPDHARYLLICGPHQARYSPSLPFDIYQALRRIAVNLVQLMDVPDTGGHLADVSRLHGRVSPLLQAHLDHYISRNEREPETDPGARHFLLRVTADQHEVIKALAAQSGRSLSDYVREMLTTGRVIVERSRLDDCLPLDQLQQWGSALNARAHKANIHRRTPSGLPAILAGIDELLNALPAG